MLHLTQLVAGRSIPDAIGDPPLLEIDGLWVEPEYLSLGRRASGTRVGRGA